MIYYCRENDLFWYFLDYFGERDFVVQKDFVFLYEYWMDLVDVWMKVAKVCDDTEFLFLFAQGYIVICKPNIITTI